MHGDEGRVTRKSIKPKLSLVTEGVIRKLPGGYFVCVWYIEYRNVRLLMTKHTIAGKGISLQV